MLLKTITTLEQRFKDAINENSHYICVIIKDKLLESPTMVIDNRNNFQNSLDYYKENYDENLKHNNSDTYIVDILSGEELNDFQFTYEVHDMNIKANDLNTMNCEGCKCNSCNFIEVHNYDECHKCGICKDIQRHCDIYNCENN